MSNYYQNSTPSEPGDYKELEACPKVVLSYNAAQFAATIGVKRRVQSLQFSKGPEYHKRPHNPARMWKNDIEGAGAELAFDKFLGVEWNAGINTFKQPDVLEYQVRSTTIPNYSLVVRQKDSDYDKYVLVIGYSMYMWDFHPPTYYIVGWIPGKDAKRSEWSYSPRENFHYYLVPQEDLDKEFETPGGAVKKAQDAPGVYLPDNIGNRS